MVRIKKQLRSRQRAKRVWRYIVAKLSNKSMVDKEPAIDDFQLKEANAILDSYEDNPSDIERDYE